MAVEFAESNWDGLNLRKGFWQHGRRPRDLLDLTPYELRYLLNEDKPPAGPGFFDAVLKSVVRNNETRGRKGLRPVIATAVRDVIAYRES